MWILAYARYVRPERMRLIIFFSGVIWRSRFSLIRFSSKYKSLLEGTFFVAWWNIWRIRNRIIFEGVLPRRSETKGRVPLHLKPSVGDSNGTHHYGEKEPYVEKDHQCIGDNSNTYPYGGKTTREVLPLLGFLKSLLLYSGKSWAVCIPQMMGGLMGGLSHSFWPWEKFSMASHASSPLNSLRFLSAAKSGSIRV
nr:RNA-directed DNA polymerase, eukaryota [Tanacetum cinerariifolium]